MQKQTFLVIGNRPPPLGGVVIFVRRRVQQLIAQGANVDVFPSKPSIAQLLQILPRWCWSHYDVIELNSFRCFWMLLLRLFFWRATIILIDHNGSYQFRYYGKAKRLCYSLAFLLVDRIDLVNPNLVQHYEDLPFRAYFQFGVRSPFIEPTQAEEVAALQTWPEELLAFVAQQKYLLVSSAFSLVLHNDEYRFFACVQAFAAIKQRYPAARLVLVAALCAEDYALKMQQLICDLQLEESVFFRVGHFEIWPIFKQAPILLRITSTDGDSISVREALQFGSQVIATDVVSRPDGVSLVPLDQQEALVTAIAELWQQQR